MKECANPGEDINVNNDACEAAFTLPDSSSSCAAPGYVENSSGVCTASTDTCDGREPDLAWMKMEEDIPLGGCDGTATDAVCEYTPSGAETTTNHKCLMGHEGGAVTCRGNGHWEVVPCTLIPLAEVDPCALVQANKPDNATMQSAFLWFHLFMYYWVNNLFLAISACCVAGAISTWYWAPGLPNPDNPDERLPGRDSKTKDMKWQGNHPIWQAVKRTYRFHIGSLAVGSFLIAVCQLIRTIIWYIDNQTKALQKTNVMLRMMFKVIHCCMWCFEKFLRFFTEDAYIVIAMRGYTFCQAGREVILIIMQNMKQLAVATIVSKFICLLGKVFISLSAMQVAYFMIRASVPEDELSSVFVPLLVTVLMAFFMSSAFLQVYALTMNTILICFVEDRQVHKECPEKAHYPRALYSVLVPKETKSNIDRKWSAVGKKADGEDEVGGMDGSCSSSY
jgi:hypothetical protein